MIDFWRRKKLGDESEGVHKVKAPSDYWARLDQLGWGIVHNHQVGQSYYEIVCFEDRIGNCGFRRRMNAGKNCEVPVIILAAPTNGIMTLKASA